jgi:hypothetical protein
MSVLDAQKRLRIIFWSKQDTCKQQHFWLSYKISYVAQAKMKINYTNTTDLPSKWKNYFNVSVYSFLVAQQATNKPIISL